MSDHLVPGSHHAIFADSWARLVRGASVADDPFHTAVLATGAAEGASLRTVVVRRVEPASRALCCHIDLRSAKIAELRQAPSAGWLLYDPAERIQLRLRGPATIHAGDGLADELWAASSPWTRR
ncbi:MAG TPA: pyridoxamine 5'-phosphate oxidase family protein, partial [Herpetosiphonaceae bacterium]